MSLLLLYELTYASCIQKYHNGFAQRILFDFLQFCIGAVAEIPASVKNADWNVQYDIAKK